MNVADPICQCDIFDLRREWWDAAIAEYNRSGVTFWCFMFGA